MELILKQYDIPLLRFSATNDSSTPEIEVHWINEDQRHLLPLDMELSPEGISRWMRRRTIPRNRTYVNRLLAKCGLNANRPMGILALCKGLSVDDSYWVVEEGFEGTFEKYNLFENRFSEVLALIAFTPLMFSTFLISTVHCLTLGSGFILMTVFSPAGFTTMRSA